MAARRGREGDAFVGAGCFCGGPSGPMLFAQIAAT
ncbi:DUF6053 domain-containing protein [Lysobacter enzymogenes]